MRCLVTGAAGFIGSRLAARLVAEGHRVIGLDDLSSGSVENLAAAPEVDLVVGDVRDARAVRDAARGCRVVFHLGALRSVARSMAAPGPTVAVNAGGTLSVLEAAGEEGAVVVFASSSSVYGDQDRLPLRESMSPRPRSPYAASKLAGEAYCQAWWRAYGTRTVALRYFNVYGPGQDPAGEYATVVPRFVLACLIGERPVIEGDGEQARDFTHVDDCVEATLLAAGAPERTWGRALNVGGGSAPTSVNRLLALVAGLTGASPEPERRPARAGDVRVTRADVSEARASIGYVPRIGIEEGLRRTVEWYRSATARAAADASTGAPAVRSRSSA
jgi:UDP-glucose 4-epimerase